MMDILTHLIEGFGIAFQPFNLGMMMLGCLLGLFIGAMPGLGSVEPKKVMT